jgi:hypothetical protein
MFRRDENNPMISIRERRVLAGQLHMTVEPHSSLSWLVGSPAFQRVGQLHPNR